MVRDYDLRSIVLRAEYSWLLSHVGFGKFQQPFFDFRNFTDLGSTYRCVIMMLIALFDGLESLYGHFASFLSHSVTIPTLPPLTGA